MDLPESLIVSPVFDKYSEPSPESGWFNVYRFSHYSGEPSKSEYSKRRDCYMITLVNGSSKICFAGEEIEIKRYGLLFSDPRIPYKWNPADKVRDGYFCIFDKLFLNKFCSPGHYSVFRSGGSHVLELPEDKAGEIAGAFESMIEENHSDYRHKNDVLRGFIFEILDYSTTLKPPVDNTRKRFNAYWRISSLFLELLERQFPIDDKHMQMTIRSVSDFAYHLGIHITILNKALKVTNRKTTKQIINERILQESVALLIQNNLSIPEIAEALRFPGEIHFNNFFINFKRISPLEFRKRIKQYN